MTISLSSLVGPGRVLHLTLLVGSCLMIASPSLAQWPTDYTSPKILGGGINTRAGALRPTDAGGVYVAYDNINVANRNLVVEKYNPLGQQVFTDVDTSENVLPSEEIILLDAPSPDEVTGVARGAAPVPGNLAITYWRFRVGPTGSWVSTTKAYGWLPMDAVNFSDSKYAIFTQTTGRRMYMKNDDAGVDPYLELSDAMYIDDVKMVAYEGKGTYACYTKVGIQPGTPTEIWGVIWSGFGTENTFKVPLKIESRAGADKSNLQLNLLDSTTPMVTWLEEYEGHKILRATVRDQFGYEASAPRDCFTDVEDYVVTTSTLGIPVFAAVTRTPDLSGQEALVGGLLNPANGGTLTIPVSNVAGVKVKDLRQEANGDFSLVYSVPENGTNLLKVRRISGVSAATLWETTVADLGWASDEIIKTYPNTWVVGNADNVLYILARYDEPGTANSRFQLVRLRADGTMGGE